MPQVINSNLSALTAQRNLNSSQNSLATSLQRLSSGLRINSAKDDAAGLAISNRFTSQINGLNQAGRNANDGISLSQTAEGGLQTIGEALDRIRVLAVQSANGTNTSSDRLALQAEVAQLTAEIQRISTATQFNGQNIIDGTLANAQFQVGANAGQTINFSIGSAKATALGTQTQFLQGSIGGTSVINGTGTAASSAVLALNRVQAQTLTVAGVATCTAALGAGSSAKTVSDLVNVDTATTGVTAKAKTAALFGAVATTGTVSFAIYGGTASASVAASVSNVNDLADLANSINLSSATTGVNAVSNGATITLTNSSGENITIEDLRNSTSIAATATLTGLDAFAVSPVASTRGAVITLTGTNLASDSATVGGSIKLDSASVFQVSTTSVAVTGGLVSVASSATVFATLASVSAVTVSTISGANDAIDVIDSALNVVNTLRANLGAIQNRFTATVNNLAITSENLSASRSRVLDADFAAETTNLSRASILQQAGVAALAQANALPNNVLALLQ